jgi:hypothetical protein
MKHDPPLLLLAIFAAVFLGVPIGLAMLLDRGRRKALRAIRSAASERGWKYRRRRWRGNPSEFRIDGWTRTGLTWIMKATGAGEITRGWSFQLALRFSTLAGEMDVFIYPRAAGHRGSAQLTPHLSSDLQAKVAAFSGTAASAVGFFREAQEMPSGLPAFDAAYKVMVLSSRVREAPVDAALAERVLHRWPADATAPHSLLAWRDPFGLHLQARFPTLPDWSNIAFLVSLAEDFCPRLPSPITSPAPQGPVDRIIARFIGS